jgi:hypothetical protein
MQEQDALDEGARQSDLDRQQRRMEFNATDKQNTAARTENARQFNVRNEAVQAALKSDHALRLKKLGIEATEVEGENAVRYATANGLNAKTARYEQGTENQQRALEHENAALFLAQYDNMSEGTPEEIEKKNKFLDAGLREVVGGRPTMTTAVFENSNMGPKDPENPGASTMHPLGESGTNVSVGTSTQNGQTTVMTANGRTVADEPNDGRPHDGAVVHSRETSYAQVAAMASLAGYQTDDTLQVLASVQKRTGASPEQLADASFAVKFLKENTAPAPTNEQAEQQNRGIGARLGRQSKGQGYQTDDGLRQDIGSNPGGGAYNFDAGNASSPEATQPRPALRASSPEATQPRPANASIDALRAARALNPGNNEAIVRAGAGQGLSAGMQDNFQAQSNLDSASLREALLDNNTSANTIAEDNNTANNEEQAKVAQHTRDTLDAIRQFQLDNPNNDIKAPVVRAGEVDKSVSFMAGKGLTNAIANLNTHKGPGYFDQPAESYKQSKAGTPKEREIENTQFAMQDMVQTATNPTYEPLFVEYFGGKPVEKWDAQDWQKVGQIILLEREGDQDDELLGNDVSTLGTVSPNAFKRHRQGDRINEKIDK